MVEILAHDLHGYVLAPQGRCRALTTGRSAEHRRTTRAKTLRLRRVSELIDMYEQRQVATMNVFKALATVVGSALGFGAAGTGIGYLLGTYAPNFFRQTFPIRDPESFNPLEIGLATGLINGLIWGLVIGILTVGIFAWKESRTSYKPEPPEK